MAIEVYNPTIPVVSTETSFQLLADVQLLEQVVLEVLIAGIIVGNVDIIVGIDGD